MKKIIIVCFAVCMAMTASLARGQGRPNSPNGRGFQRGGQTSPALKWASENMPNLFRLATDPSPTRFQYLQEAGNRFKTWSGLHDPDSKAKVQASFREEDAIFGYVVQLRQAAEDEKPAIMENITKATQTFVEGILHDREVHIKKLHDQVNEQEEKLKDDRRNIDQLVASRVKSRFLKEPATRPSGDAPSNEGQPGGSSPSAPPAGGTLAWPEQNQP